MLLKIVIFSTKLVTHSCCCDHGPAEYHGKGSHEENTSLGEHHETKENAPHEEGLPQSDHLERSNRLYDQVEWYLPGVHFYHLQYKSH